MPAIDGERLDKIAVNLHTWFVLKKKWLIDQLEAGGYPFGNVPLSEREQLTRFINMTPTDWQDLYRGLQLRHRGQPNAQELVMTDINSFRTEMESLRVRLGST